jgi:beta-glucosidase
MEAFSLPRTILLGTATASLQIEGGDKNNSWYDWSSRGNTTRDGKSSLAGNGHWRRMKEDVALMKRMNTRIYRMSVEWARIEPEKGVFDEKALRHYEREIEMLQKAGIKVMLTAHHFSNPLWFEKNGGWENPESADDFASFVTVIAERFAPLVSDWCTINEPNIYLMMGWFSGDWPPGKKGSITGYIRAAKNMIRAHRLSYAAIHMERAAQGFKDTRVGMALHLRYMVPSTKSLLDRFAVRIAERLFHGLFVKGMVEGRRIFPLSFLPSFRKGTFADFFGINYYTRDLVSFMPDPAKMFVSVKVEDGAPKNDLGWEIYPEGLYHLAKRYYARYRLPICITENGIADAKDGKRARFIYDHLYQLKRLCDEGVPVLCYCHWTNMDNFEWAEGYTARFGLVSIDYKSMKRTIRTSGRFYAEICRDNGITAAMIRKYLG